MLYMTIAKHISHPRCIIISDRPFKMLPFLHFNGRATSMAPIYGISLFIQVEFVGSGFADPCLFHGVPFLLSPLLASPPSFTTKQVRRGCPCAAQSMARRAENNECTLLDYLRVLSPHVEEAFTDLTECNKGGTQDKNT
ncbi:hypothetical protein Peur_055620 [Populus x canadensis]